MLKKQEEEAKAKMAELQKAQEEMRKQMQLEYEEKLRALQDDVGAKRKLEEEQIKKQEEKEKQMQEEQ